MTHDELRDYLDNFDAAGMVNEPTVRALRAVVELHKPTGWFKDTGYADQECIHCDNGSYPCPTIEAIEKELK